MQKHFLHQVLLQIRVGRQLCGDPLQLFYDHVLSHFVDTSGHLGIKQCSTTG